ncbi:hypothetical protein ACQR09_06560 [Bradyrhizobium oligotrophicum]|nr:hypothetical protein [Bradyrhizobium sp. SZCCHNRI1009]
MEMVDGATQIAYRLTVVPERIFDRSQVRPTAVDRDCNLDLTQGTPTGSY